MIDYIIFALGLASLILIPAIYIFGKKNTNKELTRMTAEQLKKRLLELKRSTIILCVLYSITVVLQYKSLFTAPLMLIGYILILLSMGLLWFFEIRNTKRILAQKEAEIEDEIE